MAVVFANSRVRQTVGLFIALSPLLVLLLALSRAAPAQAGNVVVGDGVNASSCNMFTLAAAMDSTADADITFACGGPATVVITQTGGLNVQHDHNITIDGGDVITLSGIDTFRLLNVQAGGALTLTHIILAHGYAASGGSFPTQGGAVLNDGATLVLDHATVRESRAVFAAGAIEDSGGTTLLKNSLIENNQSEYGGGIDSRGTLTLLNTTVRANQAITGGGLDVGGTVVISASRIFSNSADLAGGGIRVANTGLVTIDGSQLYLNQPATTTVSSRGGAIANDGTLTITHSDFYSNSAAYGGGLYNNFSGRLALTNSTISDNVASFDGGGLYNYVGGHIALTNTMVSGNSASFDGGGIFNFLVATLTVDGITLNGNSAGLGGGIYNDGHIPTISRSTIGGNSANQGGGIYNDDEILDITASTLSGNSALTGGGGIYTPGFFVRVENSTLSGNSATTGGGLYGGDQVTLFSSTFSNNSATSGGALYLDATATTLLTNTILAYSPTGGNCAGTVTSSKFSLSSDHTCALSGAVRSVDPNGLDPLLTPLGNFGGPTRVHMLKLGSPAIDGIEGNDAPTIDQRDLPRPAGGGYDIGAVERQPNDSSLLPWLWLPLTRR